MGTGQQTNLLLPFVVGCVLSPSKPTPPRYSTTRLTSLAAFVIFVDNSDARKQGSLEAPTGTEDRKHMGNAQKPAKCLLCYLTVDELRSLMSLPQDYVKRIP